MEFTDTIVKEIKAKKAYEELEKNEEGIFYMDLPCPLCPRSYSNNRPEEVGLLFSWLALKEAKGEDKEWILECPQGHIVYYDWKNNRISLSWEEKKG